MHLGKLTGLAVLALAQLTGCSEFKTALNGRPDFPPSVLLLPDAGGMVAAASAPAVAAKPEFPPETCRLVINAEDVPRAPALATTSATLPGVTFGSDDYLRLRNICIETYVAAIDYQYSVFKADLLNTTSGLGVSSDLAAAALSAASAGATGTTARILAGLSSAVLFTKKTIDQDVLNNNSIIAVINQMDADRNQRYSTILQQMQADLPSKSNSGTSSSPPSGGAAPAAPSGVAVVQSKKGVVLSETVHSVRTINVPAENGVAAHTLTITTDRKVASPKPAAAPAKPADATPSAPSQVTYTLSQAAVDLVAYYDAGTFAHAVVAMQQAGATKATNCRAVVQNLKTTGTKTGTADTNDPTATTDSATQGGSSSTAQPNAC
jgi:hypothetical protein